MRVLTQREIDIVGLIARGKCRKEIATALGVSVNTYKRYRETIGLKTGCESVAEIIRWAYDHGLVKAKRS